MSKLWSGLLAGAVAASMALASASRADEAPPVKLLAPAKGVSLDLGAKRLVGYYQAVGGQCDLTVMVGERLTDDDAIPSAPSRMAVSVAPGDAVVVDSGEGQSLAFVCAGGAVAMKVKALERVAYARRG